MHTRRVLQRDSIANVGKLAVLKDDKVLFLAQPSQLVDEVLVKVFDDVDVRLWWVAAAISNEPRTGSTACPVSP